MIYRNQTNTITQITNLSHMRITTVQEAVAFLRAIQPLNEQVASVLQRSSARMQQIVNKRTLTPPVAPAPEEKVIDPVKPFEPEDMETEEGYTEKEIEERVKKLKKANESSSKKKGN